MRFGVQLYRMDEIQQFHHMGVKVLLVSPQSFSRNQNHFLTDDEIKKVCIQAKELHMLVYLNLNTMILEEDIDLLRQSIQIWSSFSIDAFVVFDFSVYMILKEFHLENRLIYQPGTLTTNFYDPIFYSNAKIKGITLSKEITLENMIEIVSSIENIEYSYVGHGYLEMFYSRRNLITSYFEMKGINHSYKRDPNLKLEEEKRAGEFYPVLESDDGTTIYRSHPLITYQELGVISPYIKDFFIHRDFLSDEEYYDGVSLYLGHLSIDEFTKKYPSRYDSGFLYRKITLTKEGSE